MTQETHAVVAGCPEAEALHRLEAQMTAFVLQRAAPKNRTVAAELLILRCVRKLADSLETGVWSHLYDWIEAACSRYGQVLPVADLVTDAVAAAITTVSTLRPASSRSVELNRAQSEILALLARPRVHVVAGAETIDEVDVAIDELMERLEKQDALTGEHSRAVSLWCARLAERLGMDEGKKVHLARCGLVHDVGKLLTPLDVLNAPRRLTDAEVAVMRAHAADGEQIIGEIPTLARFKPAVRHHHERIDGRGYPDSLKSASISEDARIVAVADAFNAMIGNRPYRPPFPPAVALERLTADRGTHFDPEIVDAMIDVVSNRS